MRYLVIGFVAKGGGREFSSSKGYRIADDECCPSHSQIRREALDWANRDGDDFQYFQINFMQYLEEADYNSFMERDQ